MKNKTDFRQANVTKQAQDKQQSTLKDTKDKKLDKTDRTAAIPKQDNQRDQDVE